MMKKADRKLSYDEKVVKCEEFIKNYEDYDMHDVAPGYEQYGRRKYMIEMVTFPSLSNDWPMTKLRSSKFALRI